jgi:prepilin-type N-terminal cleavage/methylation domain-containing protein
MTTMKPTAKHFTRSGFTLLEVILAVAIAGMVLTAATALLVAAANAWLLRDERSFLETHASGVAQFLNTRAQNPQLAIQVDNARESGQNTRDPSRPRDRDLNASAATNGSPVPVISAIDNANTTLPETSTNRIDAAGVRWQALPGASPADEPKLVLPLAAGHPLLTSVLPAEQSVKGFLQFETSRGLFLLWSSPLQEEDSRRADELNRTLISPWVSRMEYLYLAPRNQRWEKSTTTPYDEQNTPIKPRFIRITFNRNGLETERLISLPMTINGGIPLY